MRSLEASRAGRRSRGGGGEGAISPVTELTFVQKAKVFNGLLYFQDPIIVMLEHYSLGLYYILGPTLLH